MNAIATLTSIAFAALPALNAPLGDGSFQGLVTAKDGQHLAVIYLGHAEKDATQEDQIVWAAERGAVLADRQVHNLLRTTLATPLPEGWYWTAEDFSASFAWLCYSDGNQFSNVRSAELGAVAVRLIPVVA